MPGILPQRLGLVHRYLPELIAAPLLPFLIAQGRRTRRRTPRLPAAPEPLHGVADAGFAGAPLKLLAIGESPVAGVGVRSHEEGISGQLAHAIAMHLQRPVSWQARGANGATAGEALRLLPTSSEQVDVALVAFGVNDSAAFHSAARWRKDMLTLLEALERQCAPRLVLLSGVPPLERFPALPQPLRWVIGLKGRALDTSIRELALTRPRTRHIPLAIDVADPGLMASDGYHPSDAGCRLWASVLVRGAALELACFHSGTQKR